MFAPAEGITDLQTDFEVMKSASDRHAGRSAAAAADTEKLEHAAMKAFRLRGYRGHAPRPAPKGVPLSEVRAPSGAARFAIQAAYANKRRVATMTGGVDRRVARLFAPNASFLRAGGKAKKVQKAKDKKPATIDLSRALARFKRFGELPEVSPEVIAALPRHSGINGSLLKKMIQAMLVRAGVEQNPGPDRFCACGCPLAGRLVKPEFVMIHGKKHWKCSSCSCELGERQGNRRMHPRACEEDAPSASPSPIDGVSTMEVVQPVVPRCMELAQPIVAPDPGSPSGSSSDDSSDGNSNSAGGAAASRLSSRSGRPPRGRARRARALERRALNIAQPPVQVHVHAPAPIPAPAPPPPAPVPAQIPAAAPAPRNHHLDGQVIGENDKLAILSLLVGRPVGPDEMFEDDAVLPYGGERRIATSRNVKEIAADMRICQFGCGHSAFQWGRLWLCFVTAALSGLFFSLPRLAQFQAFTFLTDFVHWCPIASLVLGSVMLLPIPFIWPRRVEERIVVAYVPHLVSAVLFEYDRSMDADLVRASIRQKFRRMSCLPIPDFDLIKFVSGSELVCEQILRSQNFFGEGAASFLLPN